MTENRYDDELLSAIIDGEATPESVAAVEADPVARQRLSDMATGVDIVASPVPEATPERRAQSIAAAMAAATPAAPEVTSLSAERHKRDEKQKKSGRPPGWLIAAAAALLLFILATPVLFNSGSVDTATEAADIAANAADEVVEEVSGDDGEEAMEDEEEAMEDEEEAMEEEAMEDEAAGDAAEAAGDAAEASGDAADTAVIESTADDADSAVAQSSVDLDIETVPSIEELELLIDDAAIIPELSTNDLLAFDTSLTRAGGGTDEVLATTVNEACFNTDQTIGNETPYSLVILDPFAGGPTLVLVEFNDDGTTRFLNAETCAVLR